ncbi:MAG TPA: MATE family efflux transporter [Caulobacteraceae bacterium]|jgi:putative MATE family efflux protein
MTLLRAEVLGERSPSWRLAKLSAPLAGFLLAPGVVNLVVLGMVGHLGATALAAIGAASTVYMVAQALLFGLDTAVQARVSRSVGAGRRDRLGLILSEALAVGTPLGLALALAVWAGAPPLLRLMLGASEAANLGAAYVRAAAPSLVFLATTIPINALWVGSARPILPLVVALATAPVQLLASWVLIGGAGPLPALGLAGAGAGQSISTLVGVGLQMALVLRRGGAPDVLHNRPTAAGVAQTLALGWPISLQQALLQCGYVATFAIVVRLGVAATAIANVLISITNLPVQLSVAVGVGAATLVGQALGAGDPAAARRWGWRASVMGTLVIAPLGLLGVVAPQTLLAPFLRNHAVLAAALLPMRLAGVTMLATPVGLILGFAFRGAGATRIAAMIPFVNQWAVTLPASFVCALVLGWGLVGLVGVQLAVSLGDAAVSIVFWNGRAWTTPRALRPRGARAAPDSLLARAGRMLAPRNGQAADIGVPAHRNGGGSSAGAVRPRGARDRQLPRGRSL